MAVSDWCKRRLISDQKATKHNSQPSNAMVLKAHRTLSPLENSLADFTRVNSEYISRFEPLRKSRIQPRVSQLDSPHLGFIYLDLFKFRDGPFLHYEGMDQFDFEGGLLSMCFKDLYVWGLRIILRRLLSYEQPSFVHIGYSHQQLSRAPFGSGNRQSQFHCPKSKIWKVWILLDYKYIIKMKLCDYPLLIWGC